MKEKLPKHLNMILLLGRHFSCELTYSRTRMLAFFLPENVTHIDSKISSPECVCVFFSDGTPINTSCNCLQTCRPLGAIIHDQPNYILKVICNAGLKLLLRMFHSFASKLETHCIFVVLSDLGYSATRLLGDLINRPQS